MSCPGTVNIDPLIHQNVPLNLCIREQQHAHLLNQPSTRSTDRKRKHPPTQSDDVTKGTVQASANAVPKPRNYVCKFVGCDRSFYKDNSLAHHERIHLGIKPYSCTWSDCKYFSESRSHIVRHIRSVHFKLSKYFKEQKQLNIEDDRDPNEFVRVDQQLASRRL